MKASQENDLKYKMKLKELNLFKEVGFILSFIDYTKDINSEKLTEIFWLFILLGNEQ